MPTEFDFHDSEVRLRLPGTVTIVADTKEEAERELVEILRETGEQHSLITA